MRVHTTDPSFLAMLQDRYAGFVTPADTAEKTAAKTAEIDFDVDLIPPNSAPDSPVRVTQHHSRWTFERGDFRAEWEPASRTGWIRTPPILIPSTLCFASRTLLCWLAREAS